VYKLDTLYSEVHPDVEKLDIAGTNICEIVPNYLSQYQHLTLKEALDHCRDAWLSAVIMYMYDKLDPEVRLYILNKIEYPGRAFIIYKETAQLTDEEDKILEKVFKGKMPKSEEALKKGKVKRKKHLSNRNKK
jgi:hypothetical protein